MMRFITSGGRQESLVLSLTNDQLSDSKMKVFDEIRLGT